VTITFPNRETEKRALVKVVIDVPDLAKNRRWLKDHKARWTSRLEQRELWMISYRIEIE
jgi:hypothetical protein